MKIAYITYKYASNRPSTIPEEYPYLKKEVEDDYIPREEELILTPEQYQQLLDSFNTVMQEHENSLLKEKLKKRMLLRSYAKDMLIVKMSHENLLRMYQGVWTQNDIKSLPNDKQLESILQDISSLSFEMAIPKIMSLNNPLITAEIKQDWINTLYAHLYI